MNELEGDSWQAGLVDEVILLLVPGIDGRHEIPVVFDGTSAERKTRPCFDAKLDGRECRLCTDLLEFIAAMNDRDPLLAPIENAEHREIGGVQLDIGRTGEGRVKRVIYPRGFRWSTHLKGVAGTDLCMHAHVGFLARGQIHIQYEDGCVLELMAPQIFSIEPGHDGWVVGGEAAIVIEFDFESDTVKRMGLPAAHVHA